MQKLFSCLVLNMCVLLVKCGDYWHLHVSEDLEEKKLHHFIVKRSNLKGFSDYSDVDIVTNKTVPCKITPFPLPLQLVKNKLQTYRGLMSEANKLSLVPPVSSPMLSYMLVPAMILAGLIPWVVPGIRMAAGFVQFINQIAFTAGLAALVRNYVFDAKPDEHIIYLNHGYGVSGHTKHHRPVP